MTHKYIKNAQHHQISEKCKINQDENRRGGSAAKSAGAEQDRQSLIPRATRWKQENQLPPSTSCLPDSTKISQCPPPRTHNVKKNLNYDELSLHVSFLIHFYFI